jgi:hypothetical protein
VFSLVLAEEFKSSLLGDVACLLELLHSLEARGVLLLGHDAALLGLHQILLGQATGSVLCRAVINLGLGAHSHRTALLLLLLLLLVLLLLVLASLAHCASILRQGKKI